MKKIYFSAFVFILSVLNVFAGNIDFVLVDGDERYDGVVGDLDNDPYTTYTYNKDVIVNSGAIYVVYGNLNITAAGSSLAGTVIVFGDLTINNTDIVDGGNIVVFGEVSITGAGPQVTVHTSVSIYAVNDPDPIYLEGEVPLSTQKDGDDLYAFLEDESNIGTDLVSVMEELETTGAIDKIGGDYQVAWDGDVGTDWSVYGNWTVDKLDSDGTTVLSTVNDKRAPNAWDDVVVVAATNMPIYGENIEIGSLNINSLATLSSSQTYTFTVNKNVAISGTWTVNAGAAIIIKGDLTINSGGSLTLAEGCQLTVEGALVNNGTFVVNNTDPSPTSIIINGSQTGNVTYNWTVEPIRWWYIGHPVSGATVAQYESSVGKSVGNDYRTYTWNAGSPGSWVNRTGTSYTFGPLEAVAFQVLNNSTVMSYTSSLNNDPSYPYTSDVVGWHQVANPYPSYIDLDQIDFGSFSPTAHIYTTYEEVRTYAEYNASKQTAATNGGSRYVAPGQSFWVELTSGTDDLVITKSACVHQAGAQLKSGDSGAEADAIRMRLRNANSNSEILVRFGAYGSESFTFYDSEKKLVSGKSANLYSLKEDKYAAINSQPLIDGEKIIPLGYKVSEDGMTDFTIQVNDLSNFEPTASVYLEDYVEGITVDLRQEREYTFTPTESHTDSRFAIRIAQVVTSVDEVLEDTEVLSQHVLIYSIKNKGVVKVTGEVLNMPNKYIEVFDLAGQLVEKIELTDEETVFELGKNNKIYIIKVNANGSTYKGKVLAQF